MRSESMQRSVRSYPRRIRARYARPEHAARRFSSQLIEVAERLKGINAAMTEVGLGEAADSLTTTIADLQWQRAELRGR